MQSGTKGTHMDYVYEMARTLREDEKLPLTLVIEKPEFIQKYPDWIVAQKYQQPLLRAIENFLLLFRLRMAGHRVFYIHYSFISAISSGIITKLFGGTVYYWNAGMPWLYKRSWLQESYQRLAYKMVDYLVTGAEALVEGYSTTYGMPKENIKVVSNWIDLNAITLNPTTREKMRQQLSIPEQAPVLLFVQKLAKRKGAHLLPEIFKQLNDENVHLIIAGDGPEEAGLEQWVSDLGLESRVHMTGRLSREKMHDLYQTADIFLLPSEEEGSPHSLIEAMSYQLPFVGFAVGGVVETIPPTLCSYLYEFGDTASLVEGIKIYLKDPTKVEDNKIVIGEWVQRFDKIHVVKLFKNLLTN